MDEMTVIPFHLVSTLFAVTYKWAWDLHVPPSWVISQTDGFARLHRHCVTACVRSLLTPNVAANQINSNRTQKVRLTYELKSNEVG